MRYVFINILICTFLNLKSQVRFNINLTIGVDTIVDLGNKVIETSAKDYVSCGTSLSPFSNFHAAYIVKTDSVGNLKWKKQYDFTPGGGDFFTDLVELPDSTYLLSGTTTDPGPDDDDVFLAKIDTGGNLIWKKQYTFPANDQSRALKLTPDGKVIIIGNTFTTGNRDGLLIKTDLTGNLIWRKTITNTVSYDEVYYSADIIKNNTEYVFGGMHGYYITGTPYFDLDIIRTDTAGNVLWQQQYGTAADETGKGGTATLDSGYVLCGTYNGEGAIIKIDKQGNWQWYKNFALQPNSIIAQVKQLPDSSFAMITSDIDWANTNRTGYLIKADKNGNMLWKRIYPHPPTTPNISNYFYGFNTTSDKGFIMTGQYNHIGQPYQNMWLVKTDSLGCDSVSCSYLVTDLTKQEILSENFEVYPNPSSSFINIKYLVLNDIAELKIISMLGQTIYQTKVTGESQVDVSQFTNGIYFIEIKSNNFTHCKKFIKQ